jgi:lysophospholipase L1-like esterase
VGNIYDVVVDGKITQTLVTTAGKNISYPLASGLSSSSSHTVTLAKHDEASFGIVTFGGFVIPGGGYAIMPKLAEPTEPTMPGVNPTKMEFIGDSITCGYGDLGTYPCDFSASTEDAMVTYAALTAANFSASFHTIAWSGKGVVRNYGDPNTTSVDPMPAYYPLTLGNNFNILWNWSLYVPDVVVINLGTNDYSTNPTPDATTFENGYKNLIATVRSAYGPTPRLFLCCGPMIGNPCCQYVQQVAMDENAAGDPNVYYVNMMNLMVYPTDYGCDDHPNQSGHQKMANVLIPAIRGAK